MPHIIVFDEFATPQKVLSVSGPSVDNGPWEASGRTDFVVVAPPDLLPLASVPKRYWKHVAGSIVEYTAAEKTIQDAADAAARAAQVVAEIAATRVNAKNQLAEFAELGLLLRAFADLMKDEINILRALHALPNRTLAQLRTAIDTRVDDGSVDE
jgi:hypothetical protein